MQGDKRSRWELERGGWGDKAMITLRKVAVFMYL